MTRLDCVVIGLALVLPAREQRSPRELSKIVELIVREIPRCREDSRRSPENSRALSDWGLTWRCPRRMTTRQFPPVAQLDAEA